MFYNHWSKGTSGIVGIIKKMNSAIQIQIMDGTMSHFMLMPSWLRPASISSLLP